MHLEQTPIFKTGNRTNLFLGGDREMVMVSGILSIVMVALTYNFFAIMCGIFLWLVALFFLRKLAKADPFMRHVYTRHINFAAYYPARSTPLRVNSRNKYSSVFGRPS